MAFATPKAGAMRSQSAAALLRRKCHGVQNDGECGLVHRRPVNFYG